MLLINHKTKNKVEMVEKYAPCQCERDEENGDGKVRRFTAMALLCNGSEFHEKRSTQCTNEAMYANKNSLSIKLSFISHLIWILNFRFLCTFSYSLFYRRRSTVWCCFDLSRLFFSCVYNFDIEL